LLTGNPREDAGLDTAEVRGDQAVPWRSAERGAGNVAQDRQWIRIEAADVVVIPGRDRCYCGAHVRGKRALHFMELDSQTRPPAGAGPMKLECATDPAVGIPPVQ
jgi:hypothetical protein